MPRSPPRWHARAERGTPLRAGGRSACQVIHAVSQTFKTPPRRVIRLRSVAKLSLAMRILFVCNPLHGHVNPMLPLARAAHNVGHDVVVATGADIAPLAQREGLTTWSAGMTHAQAGGDNQASWLEYFEASARERMADLAPRCAAWHPDLVIHEETELAGPVVAAGIGVRSVVHGLGPMLPVRLLPWVAAAIERLAPRGSASQVVEAWRAASYLHLCPPGLAPAEEPIWREVLPLRPMAPGGASDAGLMRRIEALPHARTVFVTLGTVYGGNVSALAAAIEGLRSLAVNLIVAVGPKGDPSLFEGHGRHVLIERLVPLASVLARCDAVVSQGGSGVMLGAMALGLPQLMLPQGADQFRNAEVCKPTGAALALAPPEATPHAISDSVHRLLNEGRFAGAAQVLRGQIGAMPDADAVIAALGADRHTALLGAVPASRQLAVHEVVPTAAE
jgi:UDP:flavonoid glycosyltransferase YjiC (YdhE family)